MLNKYLQHYSEPEVKSLNDFSLTIDKAYDNALVIPAYRENAQFLQHFLANDFSDSAILLILVINQPKSDTDIQPQQQLADAVTSLGNCFWQQDNLTLVQLTDKASAILLVDRFTRSINDKQGVGLARKIGADLATSLINRGLIKNPWIGSSDADATLPKHYFQALNQLPQQTAAATFSFNHSFDSKHQNDLLSQATALYEKALNYYVAGLSFAGSHYAYHSVGSSLAFHCHYYAMARGFPKRSAGEDFYLLNKLAKLGKVEKISNLSIHIKSRLSNRVPFGTGPAVEKIMALANPNEQYLYYHPQLFCELKDCLQKMSSLWFHQNCPEKWLLLHSIASQQALKQLRIEKLFLHIQQHIKSEAQCILHTRHWFDAFRTLKFLHYLQADVYLQMPLNKAIAQAPFIQT